MRGVLITPFMVFLVPWGFALTVVYLFPEVGILREISLTTFFMIMWLAVVLLSASFFFRLFFRHFSCYRVNAALMALDYDKFSKRLKHIVIVWLIVYVANIVGSGGVPLFWVLTGDARTYVDFGLPTLGGLANILRAFGLVGAYLVWKFSDFPPQIKKKYLKLGIFLLLSAFLLETGRGNGVVLLAHPLGLYFLTRRFQLKSAVVGSIWTAVFILAIGGIQILRYSYSGGIEQLMRFAENSQIDGGGFLSALMAPFLVYVAVPAVNLDLNIQVSDPIHFSPYYSLAGLVPTVVRDLIFTPQDYGVLINDANNTATFLIPFVRDFGIFGALFIATIIFFITSFVYVKAMGGRIFYILTYPAIFMSLILSFFSLFFTSLVVVLYPFLVLYMIRK